MEIATALQLLKEEADSRELDEYARLCGVPEKRIVELATQLTSHGKKAAVDVHGGMMSASGVNAAFAVLTLNTLIGNINAKGGISVGGGGFHKPALKGPRYDLVSFDGQSVPRGFPAIRCRAPYRDSTEFKKKVAARENPYPSEYPWYPLTPPNMPAEHLLAARQRQSFQVQMLDQLERQCALRAWRSQARNAQASCRSRRFAADCGYRHLSQRNQCLCGLSGAGPLHV